MATVMLQKGASASNSRWRRSLTLRRIDPLALVLAAVVLLVASCDNPAPPAQTQNRKPAETETTPSRTERRQSTPVRKAEPIEPAGFKKVRAQAEEYNAKFLIDEPPYRYYSCGYVLMIFPARPEVLERNRELYIEKQWTEEEYVTQLDNSRQLWKRLEELESVDTPEQLMDALFRWVSARTPPDRERDWKDKFKDGFAKFTAGELPPPREKAPPDG
jgi:hypothetical protein